jgi:hypothetical protein
MDDMRAVMDDVGAERAAVLGHSEGGAMCALFAATYPERTQALVMSGSAARTRWAPDYPLGAPDEVIEELQKSILESWGVELIRSLLQQLAPSIADDEELVQAQTRAALRAASPAAAAALTRMSASIDIRHVLPAIRVPTLVMHRADEVLADSRTWSRAPASSSRTVARTSSKACRANGACTPSRVPEAHTAADASNVLAVSQWTSTGGRRTKGAVSCGEEVGRAPVSRNGVVLLDDLDPLHHDPAIGFRRRPELRYLVGDTDGVADQHGRLEAPAADLEQTHQCSVEQPDALAQTRRERKDERTVSDALAVYRVRGEDRVGVERIEVAGDPGERYEIRLRDGSARCREAKPDLDVLEVQRRH